MPPTTTRLLASLLLVTQLGACTKWELQPVVPGRAFADSQYARRGVRVTTADDRSVEILRPRLTGDTIMGRAKGKGAVSVSLRDVRSLAVKRPAAGRTVLLVLGSVIGGGVLGITVLCILVCGLPPT